LVYAYIVEIYMQKSVDSARRNSALTMSINPDFKQCAPIKQYIYEYPNDTWKHHWLYLIELQHSQKDYSLSWRCICELIRWFRLHKN